MRIEGEDIGFGLRRPRITMNELSVDNGSIQNQLKISAFEIGLYRMGIGSDLVPMLEIKGGYTQKKLFLYDYILPDSAPSESHQVYRDGSTLKIKV